VDLDEKLLESCLGEKIVLGVPDFSQKRPVFMHYGVLEEVGDKGVLLQEFNKEYPTYIAFKHILIIRQM